MKTSPVWLVRAWLVAGTTVAAIGVARPGHSAAVSADVSVEKTIFSPTTGPAHPGDIIEYDILVFNHGPDLATNLLYTDILPPNTTLAPGDNGPFPVQCTAPSIGDTGTVTCIFSGLAPGAGFSLGFNVLVTSANGGRIDNTATASADTPDPDLTNNSSTASIDVTIAAVPAVSAASWAIFVLVLAAGGIVLLRR